MGNFISAIFGGGESPPPVIVPTVASPVDNSEKIKAAAQAEAERVKKRKGAASTIQTTAQGVLQPATTFKATLGA
jgi:hypothetical protein